MEGLPRLGVNIDHVATLRNARGEDYPSPIRAALMCQEFGADGITAHLREDRRHIRDKDIEEIKAQISIPLNFEMAPTDEMVDIAINTLPNACCIVPEKREEITTEGGIDVKRNHNIIAPLIDKLKKNNIRVSLFVDASNDQIELSQKVGADIVEIHSGEFCRKAHDELDYENELNKIKDSVSFAQSIGLEPHIGHGITFKSIVELSKIRGVKEFNIGHFIIGESIFIGLEESIKTFKSLIKEGRK
ncbi:MAG: pyridoxine 5'-phosphate synthase [Pelagibacteraceae bacterium]|nr:pyridoxine 5'-phosphate synthase [Pelagibacteraceae bacterium]|tara:strand:- start:824 stop:1561 length:738 start_codon:yes stop_codon:yes gene_type:complete